MPDYKSKAINTTNNLDGKVKFIWRNKMTDAYKIGNCYQDIPLDLSHYLLIRTKERLLIQNKLSAKLLDVKTSDSETTKQ